MSQPNPIYNEFKASLRDVRRYNWATVYAGGSGKEQKWQQWQKMEAEIKCGWSRFSYIFPIAFPQNSPGLKDIIPISFFILIPD